MRFLRITARWPRLGLIMILTLFALAAGLGQAMRAQTSEEQGLLAGFVSRLLSTPTSRVTIGAVDGALSSDAIIRNVAVADDAGVFLTIDRIRIVWRRAALLQRRIEVERLEIGRITLARRSSAVAGEPEPGPLLPELPLSLQVGRFAVDELALGEPVLGVAARLSASGSASLGRPADGLRAALALRRLDQPGRADLTLAFVPEGERLSLRLAHDEPAGGLLARLAGLSGTPPVRLDLQGDGVLDDWRSTLAFNGGQDLDAEGSARLLRQGTARTLTLDLRGRVAPLLPAVLVPVFAGVSAVTGDVAFRDDGAVTVRSLRLAAPLASLDIAGMVGADRTLDLSAAARAVPNTATATVVDGVRLDRLTLDARITGTATAPAVQGSLAMAGFANTRFALGSLSASFALAQQGDASALVSADARVTGFVPGDAALAEAVGPDARLVVRGVASGGVIALDLAELSGRDWALTYAGRLGGGLVDGRLALDVIRLQRLSALAGRPLGGSVKLGANLAGSGLGRDGATGRLTAVIDAGGGGLSYGDARLNAIAGPNLMLAGILTLAEGNVAVNALELRSRGARARVDGTVNAADIALTATAALTDIGMLDQRLSGLARASLRLNGRTADPDIDAVLSAPQATALGRPVRALALALRATSPMTAPRLTLRGDGEIGGKPLRLDVAMAADAADGGAARAWSVDRLAASLGSVELQGSGRLTAGLADGAVSLKASDLDDVSAILLRRMGGALTANVTASATATGGQTLGVKASGQGMAIDDIRIGGLVADLAGDDIWRRPRLAGQAELTALAAGGQRFERLAFTATGTPDGATDLSVTGRGSGFALDGSGQLMAGPPMAVRIASFAARRDGRTISLAAPATVTAAPGGIRTDNVRFAVMGGQIALAGRIGRDLDASLRVTALPLAASSILAPGLALTGTLDGEADLAGSLEAPQGAFSLSVRKLGIAAGRAAGLPPLDVAVKGQFEANRAAVNGTVRNGRAVALTVSGAIPLSADGAIDLSVRGTVDAGLANAGFVEAGQRVSGAVAVDLAVKGTAAEPQLAGGATISGGTFTDAVQGVRVTGVNGRVQADGSTLTIPRLAGRTRGDGEIVVTGRVLRAAGSDLVADLRVTARRAQLIDSGVARLVANADLAVAGPLASSPRITGSVGVLSLDVRVPERAGGAGVPLTDARHIAAPAQTRARLAQLARRAPTGRSAAQRAGGSGPVLDVAVSAPGRIFVRGRGLDAELGGNLRLTGAARQPVATGAFDLRRGRLTILTQRLDFTRGRLLFAGSLVPELDFVAETRAGDVTARVAVSGPADQPAFTFSSSPALPEDEVLSRLLFARAAGGLSPFQAIQLAQAAAQLAGEGGADVFEGARRALGVDDLDISVGADGPGIGVSRAISDRARIQLKAGATPQTTGVGVDIDLTRRLRLQGEIGADGRASGGIGFEQEY
jgi:translocation and assembly module TamB